MTATIILTYREGNTPERRANLMATLQWLAATPEFETIVVEQDTLPRLKGPLPHPRCKILYAYNPGPFNKSWGLNVGARVADSPVLVFGDADLIVPGMLAKSVQHCLGGATLVKPYRRLVDLYADESRLVRNQPLAPPQHSDPAKAADRKAQGEHLVLCGGMFALRRDAFWFLGGWDERFVGWGGEDDAFTYKLQRARVPTFEFDEVPALHLWHPRAAPGLEGQHEHYANNCALVERYRRYTDAELLRLAEVQSQIVGYREKYRPLP
jgi:glycosyltransferase involved in cell wall biosynthesis